MRALIAAGLFTLSLGWSVDDAQACSCVPTDAIHSYRVNDLALVGKVIQRSVGPNQTTYLVRVRVDLKGDIGTGEIVKVTTSSSTASCGVPLSLGERYFLVGSDLGTTGGGRQVMGINLCGFNVPVSQLSADDIHYLSTRFNTATATCNDGNPPVSCFADPCTLAAPCPTGSCEANYCGGCIAEFYTSGDFATCLPW